MDVRQEDSRRSGQLYANSDQNIVLQLFVLNEIFLLFCVRTKYHVCYNCFSSPRGFKWVLTRVEVDIVYEKALEAPRQPQGCLLPRELRNIKANGMILRPTFTS